MLSDIRAYLAQYAQLTSRQKQAIAAEDIGLLTDLIVQKAAVIAALQQCGGESLPPSVQDEVKKILTQEQENIKALTELKAREQENIRLIKTKQRAFAEYGKMLR